jgi:hypothetical protein
MIQFNFYAQLLTGCLPDVVETLDCVPAIGTLGSGVYKQEGAVMILGNKSAGYRHKITVAWHIVCLPGLGAVHKLLIADRAPDPEGPVDNVKVSLMESTCLSGSAIMVLKPQKRGAVLFRDGVNDLHLLIFPQPIKLRLHDAVLFPFGKRGHFRYPSGSPSIVHAGAEGHHHIELPFACKLNEIQKLGQCIKLNFVHPNRMLLKKWLYPVVEIRAITLASGWLPIRFDDFFQPSLVELDNISPALSSELLNTKLAKSLSIFLPPALNERKALLGNVGMVHKLAFIASNGI